MLLTLQLLASTRSSQFSVIHALWRIGFQPRPKRSPAGRSFARAACVLPKSPVRKNQSIAHRPSYCSSLEASQKNSRLLSPHRHVSSDHSNRKKNKKIKGKAGCASGTHMSVKNFILTHDRAAYFGRVALPKPVINRLIIN